MIRKITTILVILLIFSLFLTGCMKKVTEEQGTTEELGDDVSGDLSDLDALEEDLDTSDLEQFEQELEDFDW